MKNGDGRRICVMSSRVSIFESFIRTYINIRGEAPSMGFLILFFVYDSIVFFKAIIMLSFAFLQ